MSEQTLLIIFIGVLAISWFLVALVVVLVGLRVMRLVEELSFVLRRLRAAGEVVGADMNQLRERLREEGAKVRGIVDLVLGFAARKLPKSRRRSKKIAVVERDEE